MIYPQPQLDAVDQINAGLPNSQKVITTDTGNFEALWLNQGKAPFDDAAVRKAVAFSIDRAAIVQRLFGGIGVNDPLQFLNAPIVKQYVDENAFSQYKKDLSQVDKLLTGDGYAKGSDGIYAKNGQKLSFTVRTTAGNKRRELTQQILQSQLKDAGIDMQIDNAKAGDLFGEILPVGDFQACHLRPGAHHARPQHLQHCVLEELLAHRREGRQQLPAHEHPGAGHRAHQDGR